MSKKRNFLLVLSSLVALYSCKDDKVEIDTPTISASSSAELAFMGDSIPINIVANGDYPLSNIKVTFYQNGEQISESLIPTAKGGNFSKNIYVPFVKNLDDGPAEVQVKVSNKNFDFSYATLPIQVNRPKFPYLTLKTKFGNFRMEPVAGEEYTYTTTQQIPEKRVNAIIEAPAYQENGNPITFGGSEINTVVSTQDSIPFEVVNIPEAGYTITFNTKTFEGTPFLKPSFGGIEFPAFENGIAVIEAEFTQNQLIAFDGITNIADWWIDQSFLANNGDGTYNFRAVDGKYRVTADQNLKYFKIEPMDGDKLADFDPVTKTGGVWVNGGVGDQQGPAPVERLGFPSMSSNGSVWNPEKNFAMAPLGDGIYQIKLIAGVNLFMSNVPSTNGASTGGLAFYQNSRSFDNFFALDLVQTLYGSPGQPTSAGGSARFELKNSFNNLSNGAPIISTGSNRTLGANRVYVFTLDTKVSPAAVSITLE